jgi:lipopolysaccharide transport system ATP-binding protein
MQDVGEQGRTVLFVSHSMPAITRLCERTILLDKGGVLKDGPSHEVVSAYLHAGHGTGALREWQEHEAPGGEVARLRAVRIRDDAGNVSQVIDIRRPVSLEMEYQVLKGGHVLLPHFHLFNDEGMHIFSIHDVDPEWRRKPRPAGRYVSRTSIPGNFLSEGTLFLTASMIAIEPMIPQFSEDDSVSFQVVDSQQGDTARGDWAGHMGGAVRPLLNWETEYRPV